MHDYVQKKSCRYSKYFIVEKGVKFMISLMYYVDFAFFRRVLKCAVFTSPW